MRNALFGLAMALAMGSLATLVSAETTERSEAWALVYDVAGDQLGMVTFTEQGGKVLVHARLSGLAEGFHGFHVHAVGECASNFTSAGSHLNPTGSHTHPGHHGDLPSLLANAEGTAELLFMSDRLKMADLLDADGSAAIVHADPDNYGNIPTRYTLEPDATTLGTGDAGARVACGVVQ